MPRWCCNFYRAKRPLADCSIPTESPAISAPIKIYAPISKGDHRNLGSNPRLHQNIGWRNRHLGPSADLSCRLRGSDRLAPRHLRTLVPVRSASQLSSEHLPCQLSGPPRKSDSSQIRFCLGASDRLAPRRLTTLPTLSSRGRTNCDTSTRSVSDVSSLNEGSGPVELICVGQVGS